MLCNSISLQVSQPVLDALTDGQCIESSLMTWSQVPALVRTIQCSWTNLQLRSSDTNLNPRITHKKNFNHSKHMLRGTGRDVCFKQTSSPPSARNKRAVVSGSRSDALLKKGWAVKKVRVLLQVAGMLGPAACLLLAVSPIVGTSASTASSLITIGLGFSALTLGECFWVKQRSHTAPKENKSHCFTWNQGLFYFAWGSGWQLKLWTALHLFLRSISNFSADFAGVLGKFRTHESRKCPFLVICRPFWTCLGPQLDAALLFRKFLTDWIPRSSCYFGRFLEPK